MTAQMDKEGIRAGRGSLCPEGGTLGPEGADWAQALLGVAVTVTQGWERSPLPAASRPSCHRRRLDSP